MLAYLGVVVYRPQVSSAESHFRYIMHRFNGSEALGALRVLSEILLIVELAR